MQHARMSFLKRVMDGSLMRTKALLFATMLSSMLFLVMGSAEAASVYYVRAGAVGSGSGSDWTNAYTSLPATLVRGATYYIADGAYGSYTFDDAESAGTYIYLKKATAAGHGPASDWQAAYGAGQASFSGWTFNTGYYDLDGQAGGGPSSWDSGFGFAVSATKGYRISLGASVTYIAIRHTEVTNTDNTANDVNYGHLVNAQTNVSFITFSYCKLHHVFGCIFKSRAGNDNWTVEYSKFGDNTGTTANHSELWSVMGSDNIVVRYSWLFSWRSTGGLVAINGTEGSYGDNELCENWEIYGNIFEQGGSTASYVIAAIDDASNQQFARNWTVVNNTFINIDSIATSVYLCRLSTYGTAENIFQDNVLYGNTDTMQVSGVTYEDENSYQGASTFFKSSYDSALTSSPFVNYTGGDYRLSAALPGMSLGARYGIDMLGNTRGADGTWDRGAFEYSFGSPPPSVKPAAPTNLIVQ